MVCFLTNNGQPPLQLSERPLGAGQSTFRQTFSSASLESGFTRIYGRRTGRVQNGFAQCSFDLDGFLGDTHAGIAADAALSKRAPAGHNRGWIAGQHSGCPAGRMDIQALIHAVASPTR